MQFQLGVVFFLWVGLFSLMVVAQFWAFANDIYTEEQGKRLFAIIGIGSSLGAIFGAQVAGWLFEPIGPFSMMAVAAGLLAVCMILTNWIHAREGSANRRRPDAAHPIGTSGGFRLVLRHRYLLLIAILVLLSNLVNTTGEFILGKTVAQHAKGLPNGEAYIGEFYAGFFLWVNLLGAALQMFAVSRIMKYLGIGPALFILPVIALGSYTLLAFAPVLSYIRVAKIAENSADYSIQSTSRHALFLKTSREAKYKAQSAIESFSGGPAMRWPRCWFSLEQDSLSIFQSSRSRIRFWFWSGWPWRSRLCGFGSVSAWRRRRSGGRHETSGSILRTSPGHSQAGTWTGPAHVGVLTAGHRFIYNDQSGT